MKIIIFCIISLRISQSYALSMTDLLWGEGPNTTTIDTPMSLLTFIANTLLWGVLPVVVVGVSLYIAYELFTAQGSPEKLKNAWKALLYGAAGIIFALLSYALIKIASTFSLF